MVTHMKTTIDITDPLLRKAKARASREGTTLREVVEEALRRYLEVQPQRKRPFKLRDCTFTGRGLIPGVDLADWETIRDIIYEGRGG